MEDVVKFMKQKDFGAWLIDKMMPWYENYHSKISHSKIPSHDCSATDQELCPICEPL